MILDYKQKERYPFMGVLKKRKKDKKETRDDVRSRLHDLHPSLAVQMMKANETEQDQILRMKIEMELKEKERQREETQKAEIQLRIQEIREKARKLKEQKEAKRTDHDEKIDRLVKLFNDLTKFYQLIASPDVNTRIKQVFLELNEIKSAIKEHLALSSVGLDVDAFLQELMMKSVPEMNEEEIIQLKFKIFTWLITVFNALSTDFARLDRSDAKQEAKSRFVQLENDLKIQLETIRKNYEHQILVALIILGKDTGVPYVAYEFGSLSLQSDLITGFLSAIQSFASEIVKRQAKMRRLTFAEFIIEMFEGDKSIMALILKGPITKKLHDNCTHVIREFEVDFRDVLTNFDGNIGQFRPFIEKISGLL